MRGLESFEPYLSRLEHLPEDILENAAASIPPEWYDGQTDSLSSLVHELSERRRMIAAMLEACRNSAPDSFPQWRADA